MIKLNDNYIFIGEIKQILANFNLPLCDVGDSYPINDKHFILNNNIYRWQVNKATNYATKVLCDKYLYGKKYVNLTSNFQIQNMIYDRYTHRYLGKYLRFLRDYSNLDLMSMYNCFDGEVILNIPDGLAIAQESDYTIYKVPISLRSNFTILVNQYVNVELCLYVDNKFVAIDDNKQLSQRTYKHGKFNKSFIYPAIDLIYDQVYLEELVDKYKDDLCLLIKIPSSCPGNIVVIEGIYDSRLNHKQQMLIYKPAIYLDKKFLTQYPPTSDNEQSNDLDKTLQVFRDKFLTTNKQKFLYVQSGNVTYSNELMYSGYRMNLQLLSTESGNARYLLADKLVEYLTKNAINPTSASYDIKSLQKYIDKKLRIASPKDPSYSSIPTADYINTDRYYGLWNPRDLLNLRLFAANKKINLKKYDVLGYLDSDIEHAIQGQLDDVMLEEIEGDYN